MTKEWKGETVYAGKLLGSLLQCATLSYLCERINSYGCGIVDGKRLTQNSSQFVKFKDPRYYPSGRS